MILYVVRYARFTCIIFIKEENQMQFGIIIIVKTMGKMHFISSFLPTMLIKKDAASDHTAL
jgi:hypothetical protein